MRRSCRRASASSTSTTTTSSRARNTTRSTAAQPAPLAAGARAAAAPTRSKRRSIMFQYPRLAAVLCGAAFATGASAAPHAESALECGIAADMAVVAHSLAKEQIQRTKADIIMARIYDVSRSDRGKELMKDILDAAYISKG